VADLLFAYGPYFALFGFAAAQLWRWGVLDGVTAPPVREVSALAEGALVTGLGVLLAGHFSTLLMPEAMAALLSSPLRLAVVEAIGLSGAVLFAFGVQARLRRRVSALRRGDARQWLPVAVLALTLWVCLSGIALSIGARWITAWYAHLAVPYLRSLVSLAPETAPLAAAPLGIQAHVVSFMVLLALWPLGALPWSELLPWRPVLRRLSGATAVESAS
jgi:nitrate reductase gamma subunit